MEEIWLPVNIDGYRDSHLVSNKGRIKTTKGRVLKQRFDTDGYYQVNMCNNGKEKTFKVHRIVALTFLSDDFKNGLVVNHKDGCKTNNNIENLEFVTVAYNTKHAVEHNLVKVGYDNPTSKPILLKHANGAIISQYETVHYFEELTGIHRGCFDKLNIEFVDKIKFYLPINLELNKIKNNCLREPIKIMNLNKDVLAIYPNLMAMERLSTISRRIAPRLDYNKPYLYKKNGRQYKEKYLIQRITKEEYLFIDSPIIDDTLEVK